MNSKTLPGPRKSFCSAMFSSICAQSYLSARMWTTHAGCENCLCDWLRTWEVTSGPGIARIKTVSREWRENEPGWKQMRVNILFVPHLKEDESAESFSLNCGLLM